MRVPSSPKLFTADSSVSAITVFTITASLPDVNMHTSNTRPMVNVAAEFG
jgi:hypothetical protein